MSVSFWSFVDSCHIGNHTTSSFLYFDKGYSYYISFILVSPKLDKGIQKNTLVYITLHICTFVEEALNMSFLQRYDQYSRQVNIRENPVCHL